MSMDFTGLLIYGIDLGKGDKWLNAADRLPRSGPVDLQRYGMEGEEGWALTARDFSSGFWGSPKRIPDLSSLDYAEMDKQLRAAAKRIKFHGDSTPGWILTAHYER